MASGCCLYAAEVSVAMLEQGYAVLFLVLIADQSGFPLPAAPFLVTAGAMIRAGRLDLWAVLGLSLLASLIGHTAWYWAGRSRGHKILQRVCTLSLEPDACVRRTQDLFAKWGAVSLIAARFVPGLDIMAQPLAGIIGMSWPRYLLLNIAGALLWASAFLGLGVAFGKELQSAIAPALHLMGVWLAPMLVVGIMIYFGVKLARRFSIIQGLQVTRMSVDELKRRMDAGDPITVFDLRHPLEARLFPHTIPGAKRFPRDDLSSHIESMPPSQEVVVFCNCPHEIASARIAVALAARGFTNVRPLDGGLDAWERRKYPVVPL